MSTNGGLTWTTHNTGLADWTMVYDLVSSAADRSLICFTHGHGALRRSLNDVISDVNVHPAVTPFSVSVFPNPVNDNATLVFGESFGLTKISIYDLQGKILFTQELLLDPASPVVRVDVSEWPVGCYIAEAVNGKRRGTTRILVTR